MGFLLKIHSRFDLFNIQRFCTQPFVSAPQTARFGTRYGFVSAPQTVEYCTYSTLTLWDCCDGVTKYQKIVDTYPIVCKIAALYTRITFDTGKTRNLNLHHTGTVCLNFLTDCLQYYLFIFCNFRRFFHRKTKTVFFVNQLWEHMRVCVNKYFIKRYKVSFLNIDSVRIKT